MRARGVKKRTRGRGAGKGSRIVGEKAQGSEMERWEARVEEIGLQAVPCYAIDEVAEGADRDGCILVNSLDATFACEQCWGIIVIDLIYSPSRSAPAAVPLPKAA